MGQSSTPVFERNRVDSGLQQTTVPAEITLDDGLVLKGKFIISAARSIYEALNGDSTFLEFEPYGAERNYIAKSALRTVKIVTVAAPGDLAVRLKEIDKFDPYATLGLRAGASWEEVRQAYHQLSKVYHPDRYANAELPVEVRDYLAAMARRLNAAYAALEPVMKVPRDAAAERVEAVYTSPARG